jgi:hypothetical protein
MHEWSLATYAGSVRALYFYTHLEPVERNAVQFKMLRTYSHQDDGQ